MREVDEKKRKLASKLQQQTSSRNLKTTNQTKQSNLNLDQINETHLKRVFLMRFKLMTFVNCMHDLILNQVKLAE
jgi:hypothetical protein